MTLLKSTILSKLEADNRMYCDYNQTAPSDCQLMAAKGHPASSAYQELRDFFDSLKYACNSGARRFTYKHKLECSEYWAPGLDISWYPKGVLSKFGHIYPAHSRWSEYIDEAASAGWPAGCSPKLDGGSWLIRTQSIALHTKFLELQSKTTESGRFTVKTEIDTESKQAYYAIDISLFDVPRALPLQKKILALLSRYQKSHILPKRTPEQNSIETAELPLAEKSFMLANVKHVTVSPRHVLVPLNALPVDETLVLKHCEDLQELCAKGFPFALIKDWLSKILKPESIEAMQLKFS